MTCVFYECLYPETSTKCTICSGGEKDCTHLFFRLSLCQDNMDQQSTLSVDTISETSFWDLIRSGRRRRKEERGHILAVLWAIWLHWNNKLFRGRAVYAMEGVVVA